MSAPIELPQIDRGVDGFASALQDVVSRYMEAEAMTYGEALGVLEIVKAVLLRRMFEQDEED